nr:unnamed protein product [Callosobruchus chinensis]
MIWHEHVSSIATAAGKKLGYLFGARNYFSPSNLLTLYKAQIRPSLEYCSHIWGAAAPTTLSILDAVQRRAIRLIGIMSNRPISVVELVRRRLATATSLSNDIEVITAWGLKDVPGSAKKSLIQALGVSITDNMIWHEHVSSIATAAGKKLGYLIRARKYLLPFNLLTFYKTQIRPSLEYCSHIWGDAAPTILFIIDAVQRRAIRLIGDPALTCHFQPLSRRRAVGGLLLFYRYLNGFCSSQLTSIIPPLTKPA